MEKDEEGRSQHQLLVQTNLAKIEARRLFFQLFNPLHIAKEDIPITSDSLYCVADNENKPSLPCGKLLDSNWRWILDPSREKSLGRPKNVFFHDSQLQCHNH